MQKTFACKEFKEGCVKSTNAMFADSPDFRHVSQTIH